MNCCASQSSKCNTNSYGNTFFIILVLFILLAIIVSSIYAY
ncbi:MAG: YjcZ family sporulation protein [Bacilli bacterium]|nr:YjcZ family sporulation protein [Bacilli bacterium]